MNHKDILKLRGIRDTFKDLSVEHWSYYTDIDDPELKAFHKGKSYAYDVAAERIDRIINTESEEDISRVAKWMPEGTYRILYRCSYCGNAESYPYKFCGNCGCEMQNEKEELEGWMYTNNHLDLIEED